jgi:hypothetical protein
MSGRWVTEDDVRAMLADEAEEAEAARGRAAASGPLQPTPPPRDPAQVYSVRVPVHALERLCRLASAAALTPAALMRAWVLERMEVEADGRAADERLRMGVRAELERAGLVRRRGRGRTARRPRRETP